MKRIVTLLLAVIMTIGCGIISVSAQNNKIQPELQIILDTCKPDDTVQVLIMYAYYEKKTVADMPSWPNRIAANAEFKAYCAEKQAEIQSIIFQGETVEWVANWFSEGVIVTVSAAAVERIARFDIVRTIDYYENRVYHSNAEIPTETPNESPYLFEEKFKELLAKNYGGAYTGYHYNELYYHYDENGEIDWTLFEGTIDGLGSLYGHSFVGNRLITQRNGFRPFFGKMGIYSVKYDGVYDAALVKHELFDDLEAVYNEIGYGVLMGDLDHDDEISIADVTVLQRCLVGMRDFPTTDSIDVLNDNYLHGVHYYSDFNRDGERDILDATCIQRYLADLPYPVEK